MSNVLLSDMVLPFFCLTLNCLLYGYRLKKSLKHFIEQLYLNGFLFFCMGAYADLLALHPRMFLYLL